MRNGGLNMLLSRVVATTTTTTTKTYKVKWKALFEIYYVFC